MEVGVTAEEKLFGHSVKVESAGKVDMVVVGGGVICFDQTVMEPLEHHLRISHPTPP